MTESIQQIFFQYDGLVFWVERYIMRNGIKTDWKYQHVIWVKGDRVK